MTQQDPTDSELRAVYYVDRVVAWVRRRGCVKVAVQFSPASTAHLAPVFRLLQTSLAPTVALTAIFSPRLASCCISQKAASYRNHDAIIQFGRSCLTPSAKIPVLRVFAPNWPVDAAKMVSGILSTPEISEFVIGCEAVGCGDGSTDHPPEEAELMDVSTNSKLEKSPKELVVIYDTRCAHAIGMVKKICKERNTVNMQFSRLLIREDPTDPCSPKEGFTKVHSFSGSTKQTRQKDKQSGCCRTELTTSKDCESKQNTQQCCQSQPVIPQACVSGVNSSKPCTSDEQTSVFLDTDQIEEGCCEAESSSDQEPDIIKDTLYVESCVCYDDLSLGICGFCLQDVEENLETPFKWIEEVDGKEMDDSGILELEGSFLGKSTGNRPILCSNGRVFNAPRSLNRSDLVFAYIGDQGCSLTSMMLKWAQCSFYVVNPSTGEVKSVNAARHVWQRSSKIHKISEANTIGIVTSNLNLPGRVEIQRNMSSLIRNADKKVLKIYTSDPDVHKLCNFTESGVDVFVLISCAESTIFHRDTDPEMYKYLVAPWEVEMALNANRGWSAAFETDCSQLLVGGSAYVAPPTADTMDQSTSMSLVSGHITSLGAGQAEVASVVPLGVSTVALETDANKRLAAVEGAVRAHAAGLLWGDVFWRGLDPTAAPALPLGAVQGRRGVASEYGRETD